MTNGGPRELPQRPGDQLPGTSQNIMATFYRDELQTEPRRRVWPLLLFPAVVVAGLAALALVRVLG
jgi:hypothetical protein